MQLKWLGHASFELRIGKIIMYIDPYAGEYTDKADIILITHSHYDHFNREIVDKIRKEDTTIIGPASVASEIDGCRSVIAGEKGRVYGLTVQTVAAYNTSSTPRQTHSREEGVGFVIETGEYSIYHAGDTSFIPEMKDINADIILLPVGGTYTMDAKQAAEAAKLINPKIAIPMHYGRVVGTKDSALYFKELVEEAGIPVQIMDKNQWQDI
jgi:L-ascorbate metabolism protein UlaG (beta-lactamase superfamily)